MKINQNENIILVDLDNTMIRPTKKLYGYNVKDISYYGILKKREFHLEHIDLIKSYKKRGFFIRVHTNNGWQWAEEVIKVLGIEEYIDELETKASKFVDDAELPSNEVIGQRVFIPWPED